VADIKPFRAVRYDERRAGPIDSLIAPPYDVIDDAMRERYLEASPYNVVHLTLPNSELEAAEHWSSWLADGVLAGDDAPTLWWLAQDYVGPDGVARRRHGLLCALRVEPYASRVVLPHERTHAGPKEGRLRLLRALRVHVEPIFLLYDGSLEGPHGKALAEAELDGVRNRLWRLPGDPPEELAEAQLLIADGHHRYETALAFHEEDGSEESAWLMVVVCPTEQEGLTIFPTHRIAHRLGAVEGRRAPSVDDALGLLPEDRSGAVVYRGGEAIAVEGEQGEPDAALVERLGPEGVTYTADVDEAIAAADDGSAEAALIVRPTPIELVRDIALRGETMPQKSTYFFPKLPSGLVFMPLCHSTL
jgi:uncharacterized protein (DUF1015 family)